MHEIFPTSGIWTHHLPSWTVFWWLDRLLRCASLCPCHLSPNWKPLTSGRPLRGYKNHSRGCLQACTIIMRCLLHLRTTKTIPSKHSLQSMFIIEKNNSNKVNTQNRALRLCSAHPSCRGTRLQRRRRRSGRCRPEPSGPLRRWLRTLKSLKSGLK